MEHVANLSKRMCNSELEALLLRTSKNLKEADNIQSVTTLLDELDSSDIELKFDNKGMYIFLSVLLVLISGYTYTILNSRLYNDSNWYFYTWLFLLLFLAVPIGFILDRRKQFANITDEFVAKTLSLLYKIKSLDSSARQQLLRSFYDFQRGNYSRNIDWAKSIQIEHEQEVTEAIVVHLHYVDERYVIEQKNGKKVKRKVYDHFHREGIIVPNKLNFKPMIISQNLIINAYPESFTPASKEFNKHYKVQSESQFDTAKLLGPTAVVTFEGLADKFSQITYEISANSGILLCQKHTGLLSFTPKNTVKNPLDLKNELLNNTELDWLNKLIAFNVKIFSTQGV